MRPMRWWRRGARALLFARVIQKHPTYPAFSVGAEFAWSWARCSRMNTILWSCHWTWRCLHCWFRGSGRWSGCFPTIRQNNNSCKKQKLKNLIALSFRGFLLELLESVLSFLWLPFWVRGIIILRRIIMLEGAQMNLEWNVRFTLSATFGTMIWIGFISALILRW